MRIEWSEDALGDLREIISYVSSSFGGRKAIEVFGEIRDAVNLLSDYPFMGKVFVKDTMMSGTYYTVPSKLHQIVYFVDSETINIVAVWNNRRDIRRLKRRLIHRSNTRK